MTTRCFFSFNKILIKKSAYFLWLISFFSVNLVAFQSETALEKKEAELLEKIIYQRKQKRKKLKKASVYSHTEWRPRGASVDGEYILFEFRNTRHKPPYGMVAFNTYEETRKFYYFNTYESRNAFLTNYKTDLKKRFIETAVASYTPDGSGLWKTKTGTIYKFYFVKEKRIWYLNVISKSKNTSTRLAAYPFENTPNKKPEVSKIFIINNHYGFGLKIRISANDTQNRLTVTEDVLMFNNTKNYTNRKILRKNNWTLTEKQRKIIYMTDLIYGYQNSPTEKIFYYLSGHKMKQTTAAYPK